MFSNGGLLKRQLMIIHFWLNTKKSSNVAALGIHKVANSWRRVTSQGYGKVLSAKSSLLEWPKAFRAEYAAPDFYKAWSLVGVIPSKPGKKMVKRKKAAM